MLGYEDFKGRWQLSRVITDRHSDQVGSLSGTARFDPIGEGALLYSEVGDLRFGDGPTMVAKRCNRWAFGVSVVDVFFEDGGVFHSFVPAGLPQGTDHPCGADFYQVRYDF